MGFSVNNDLLLRNKLNNYTNSKYQNYIIEFSSVYTKKYFLYS